MFGGRCDRKLFEKFLVWCDNSNPKVVKSPYMYNFMFRVTLSTLEHIANPLKEAGLNPISVTEEIHKEVMKVVEESIKEYISQNKPIEELKEKVKRDVKNVLSNR